MTSGSSTINYRHKYSLSQSGYSIDQIYQTRVVSTGYSISGSTTIAWGGDVVDPSNYATYSFAYLQYVRMYWGWVADSQDKMINLALMDTGGKLKF